MYEIPLFPLNVVLFPGMPLHLHIFEDRYQKMINWCIAEDQPFGMVLANQNSTVLGANGAPEPNRIGCAAHIQQVKPLRDGRMDIVNIGKERFNVVDFKYDQPYLVGVVEDIELHKNLDKEDKIKGAYLKKLLKNYLNVLSTMGNMEINLEELPKEPIKTAYLAASLMQIPLHQKQSILEINDAQELIGKVHTDLRHEISILRNMLDPNVSPNQEGPFSLN